jgi:hypothetical protein
MSQAKASPAASTSAGGRTVQGGTVASSLRMSLAALLVATMPGCSLIFTRGPQPELHARPECTESVAAPVVDTVLAALSVTLLGLGIAAEAESSTPCTGEFCSLNGIGQGSGWIAIAAGAATGILFTTSAVVGYQRTSACRASLEPNALLPRPKASLLPVSPGEACAAVGDAPRTCPGLARRDESPVGRGRVQLNKL